MKNSTLTRIVAVTGDVEMARQLQAEFQHELRPQDEIVVGNWNDPDFLNHLEPFDVILADYLIGALDGFAPYFQDQLLPRIQQNLLKPHGMMHIIGMEPFPDEATCPQAQLIHEMANVRDACIRLASHRCYREYPKEWVIRQLKGIGGRVCFNQSFPIRYTAQVICRQLRVARNKLAFFPSPELAASMNFYISNLEKRATNVNGFTFGSDYVLSIEW